ncbi:ABC transporter substrate-binding protein [Rhodococcoides yunnanense]|uniref:ABC transporter substrate-binding protein n=1 Tax=Rhodococcoides yunnanense TaxID=278209 RepID=UPI00278C8027|nr:ABC transporter substrate-binding protein [Rhodococcus yunnanensis]
MGDPVAGGVGRIYQVSEPRSLDPAALANNWANYGFLGNALYGTLMVNDTETFEIEYKMAEDFSTTDGGKTFTLKLQPDLKFSDGSPLDAAAVKFNWDRTREPGLGTTSQRYAVQIADNTVLDPTTLKVTLVEPNPHFGQIVSSSILNWIASPAALAQDRAAFDAAPIGAGPFTLTSWTRQNTIELAKNPTYWDAPKPYLDTLTLRSSADTNQRYNTLTTGGVDLTVETSWETLAKAEDADLTTDIAPMGGGQYLAFNFRRAPFDDERARRAVALAVDVDALNVAITNGKAEIPQTLFPESSPFYSDISLQNTDKEEAQRLFDELAAEGKPVSFTFTAFQAVKPAAEAVQAQLSAFDNVDVKVDVVESTAGQQIQAAHDFDMMVTAAMVQDPDSDLWNMFNGAALQNFTGVDDQELTDALDAGRVSESQEERKAAYDIVQQRFVDTVVGVWYSRVPPATIANTNVHGIQLYGYGSLLPEELWITQK